MYNHAPKNYKCPFCSITKNSNKSFIVFRDNHITAFISHWQWPKNSGTVVVMPNRHFENIYEIPDKLNAKVYKLSKRIALAMRKSYECDGVSLRQHNEAAGQQTAWHYHVQITPRYTKDNFYGDYEKRRAIAVTKRKKFTDIMKKCLSKE